jgi:hypothetical protein
LLDQKGNDRTIKKPYVREYGQVAGFTVWIVDGQYIREKINEEFTNFGQHYRFRFIPQNEFWIDHEYGAGEEEFFIDHMLVEYRLMAFGMSYNKALEKADLVEKKERKKAEYIKRMASLDRKHLLENIHKRLLKPYSGKVKVWLIRGDLVRDFYFIDFTEGGHDKVYHFVPENEVWLDDDLSPKERKFVLLHELHERHLMSQGWVYHRAHRSASEIEHYCRIHPEELENKLRIEIDRNQ